MIRRLLLAGACLLLLLEMGSAAEPARSRITLVIHGGAGTMTRSEMTPEKEQAYRDALRGALLAGFDVLKKGGSSLDAVEAALRPLEDSPLFNAGKGSVFNSEGKIEMDAAIMDGRTLKAGAVAAVTTVKNPIRAARAVMDHSPHVLLMGHGADEFAAQQGLEIVDPSYFYTDYRYQQLLEEKKKEQQEQEQTMPATQTRESHFGTVGAVALDAHGNLAAGTSTGGRTNKHYGRVGDTPIIGAGTYADNRTCAVSATGFGEYFIRTVAAYHVSALMEFKHLPVKKAAEETLRQIQELGGDGGMIALDHEGNYAMPFNTPGMYRAVITSDGKITVEIYR